MINFKREAEGKRREVYEADDKRKKVREHLGLKEDL